MCTLISDSNYIKMYREIINNHLYLFLYTYTLVAFGPKCKPVIITRPVQ